MTNSEKKCRNCKFEKLTESQMPCKLCIDEIEELEENRFAMKHVYWQPKPEIIKIDYWKKICDMQQKQQNKGLIKYGLKLEDDFAMDALTRINHLQEELIDGLMYCEHIKQYILSMEAKTNDKCE